MATRARKGRRATPAFPARRELRVHRDPRVWLDLKVQTVRRDRPVPKALKGPQARKALVVRAALHGEDRGFPRRRTQWMMSSNQAAARISVSWPIRIKHRLTPRTGILLPPRVTRARRVLKAYRVFRVPRVQRARPGRRGRKALMVRKGHRVWLGRKAGPDSLARRDQRVRRGPRVLRGLRARKAPPGRAA